MFGDILRVGCSDAQARTTRYKHPAEAECQFAVRGLACWVRNYEPTAEARGSPKQHLDWMLVVTSGSVRV